MSDSHEEAAGPDTIQSVILALNLMEHLASSHRSLGVGELAQQLEVGKSRIFRHLQTLCSRGYVIQDPLTEKYMPGPAWHFIQTKIKEGPSLDWMAGPVIATLASQTGLTACLVQFGDDGLRTICSAIAPERISIALPDGVQMPAFATAFGKVGLAFADERWVKRHMPTTEVRFTEATIVAEADLAAEIARVRAQGWATSHGEWVSGISALAAPIAWRGGPAICAVGVMGYGGSIGRSPAEELKQAVLLAASELAGLWLNSWDRRAPGETKGRRKRPAGLHGEAPPKR